MYMYSIRTSPGDRGPAAVVDVHGPQRHINGVVPKNNRYNSFGSGGEKTALLVRPGLIRPGLCSPMLLLLLYYYYTIIIILLLLYYYYYIIIIIILLLLLLYYYCYYI